MKRFSLSVGLSASLLAVAHCSQKQLLVGLKHTSDGEAELKRRFWGVADPTSAEYQMHATRDELAELVLPSEETRAAAHIWLRSLNADMSTLRTVSTGDALMVDVETSNSTAPAVPSELRTALDYVILMSPGVAPKPMLRSQLRSKVGSTDDGLGPQAQKAQYGVPADLKGTNAKNLQMVFGTGTFGYREDDLNLFFSTYAPEASSKHVSLDKENAWKDKTGKNFVEGMLDTSYISAFAPGVKTIVANPNASASTEAGEDYGAALLSFLVDLNGRDEVPLVLSMSLGSLSFGSCDRACKAVAKKGGHAYKDCWDFMQTKFQACMFSSAEVEARIDMEFAKLGLRGVTILTASGDGGSHFAFGPFEGSIGSTLNEVICAGLHMPVYPTASPYVLSIGGTEWQADDEYGPTCSKASPNGWESGGGGFSWDMAAPYQANTIPAYLTLEEKVAPKMAPKAGSFNASGRGYPDFAALAQFGIPLCTYGGCSGSGGTSASAPTVAGMLSLINDARLTKNLKPLGFINTKLYTLMADASKRAECFKDIGIDSVGSLWDCQTYSTCAGCDGDNKGFVSTAGWDAQTGFGEPRFTGLMKYLGSDSTGEISEILV